MTDFCIVLHKPQFFKLTGTYNACAEHPGLRQLATLIINKLLLGPRPSGAWPGLLFNIAPFTGRPVRFGMLSQYYPANTPASFRGRPQYHCFARLQCGLQVQPRKAQGREDFVVGGGGGSPVRALVWTIVRVNAPPNQIDCMHLYCCCCCCCMSAVGLGILFQLTGWPVVRGKLFWYCTLHLHMCAYASPRVLCCIVHESCIVRVVVFFRSQQHVTAFNPSFVDSSN